MRRINNLTTMKNLFRYTHAKVIRMGMNIKDIAALSETSIATVSRVINCDASVSEETRKRVLDVIAATGYKPNLVRKALRSQKKGNILVLLPTIAHPYYSKVLEGVEERAGDNNYDVLMCTTNRNADTEKRYLGLIETRQVDGIILFTTALNDVELNVFAEKYPIVQCAANAEVIANISFACIDNVAASDDAVSYFVKLGHSRIALINGPFGRPYEVDRQEGYRRVLAREGLEVNSRYMTVSGYDFIDARAACGRLLEQKNPPTAIFCASDLMAVGAVKYCVESGIRPGLDVDIIGFDGTYLNQLVSPEITCIEQPALEMGMTAFDLLEEKIRNNKSMSKKVVMPHKLVIRQSTRKPPDADFQ